VLEGHDSPLPGTGLGMACDPVLVINCNEKSQCHQSHRRESVMKKIPLSDRQKPYLPQIIEATLSAS